MHDAAAIDAANDRARMMVTASLADDAALLTELVVAETDPALVMSALAGHAAGLARHAALGVEMDPAAFWRTICERFQ